MPVYVENGTGMADTLESAAWVFNLDWWGRCGRGGSEAAALGDLRRFIRLSGPVEIVVSERIDGDEGAFARDRVPCSGAPGDRGDPLRDSAPDDRAVAVLLGCAAGLR